jgi:hypothetical protein
MTSPATPLEVIQKLGELTGQLDRTVDQLVAADLDMVRKRHAADQEESRAFLRAEGAMELRKHKARVFAADEEEQALVAESVVRSLKQRIKALEIRIDVGRTYGATVRAELKTLGWAEG